MSTPRTARELGDAAEAEVAERLVAGGWAVLARNVRVGRDELDLVGIDPGPPRTLVVVEVRWRGRRDFGLAEESLDHRKRRGPAARAWPGCWTRAPPRRDAPCRGCRSGSTSSRSTGDRTGGRRSAITAGSGPDRSGRRRPIGSGRDPVLHSAAAPDGPDDNRPFRVYGPRRSTHADHGPGRDGAGPGAGRETRADGPAGDPRRHNRRRSLQCPPSSMRQLLEAGVHFGHQTRRWNPKMRPFIFAERNGIHIIDLAQTVKRLDTALEFVTETVARGESVLFVGTKKQAQEPVMQEAMRAGQPYVTKRWLGGMMTNFVTIKKRIGLLDQLEARQLAGDFDRLPKKEAAGLTEELNKLNAMLGGIRKMKRLPGADLHRRPAPRAHRGDRGQQARDPGHRHGRHQRRPGRARLHHPGQRRRDPRDPAALPAGRRRGDRGRRPARGARLVRARGPGAPGRRGARVRRDRRGRPGRPARRRRDPVVRPRPGRRGPAARLAAARDARARRRRAAQTHRPTHRPRTRPPTDPARRIADRRSAWASTTNTDGARRVRTPYARDTGATRPWQSRPTPSRSSASEPARA